MKSTTLLAAATLVIGTFISQAAVAKTCSHDVHGAPTIEVTELSENYSIIHYFSPATLVMDDTSDPRHRAFGECRGQATVMNGVENWSGACLWKDVDGDAYVCHWWSKPSDKGVENRDALHGTAECGAASSGSTGKFAGSKVITAKWSGLANGGSYWCED